MYCIRCGREEGCGSSDGGNIWKLVYSIGEEGSTNTRYDVALHNCERGVPNKFNVYRHYHSIGLCPDCILNEQPNE